MTSSENAKRKWLERYRAWRASRKEVQQSHLVATDRDTVQLAIRRQPVPTLFRGYRVALSGLHCGVWGDVELECWQPLHEGENFLETPEMLIRASAAEGFRGLTTASALLAQAAQLPPAWRARRLYFLGHFLFDKEESRFIVKLECVGQCWNLEVVPLDDNCWKVGDYFIRQRV